MEKALTLNVFTKKTFNPESMTHSLYVDKIQLITVEQVAQLEVHQAPVENSQVR